MPVITVMRRPLDKVSEGFRFDMILITQIYRTIKQTLYASYITSIYWLLRSNTIHVDFIPLEYVFTLGQSHYTLYV